MLHPLISLSAVLKKDTTQSIITQMASVSFVMAALALYFHIKLPPLFSQAYKLKLISLTNVILNPGPVRVFPAANAPKLLNRNFLQPCRAVDT